ncbi:hypothetical protein GEMRC1_006444 [Eukaryota sp. GEM-RC1]
MSTSFRVRQRFPKQQMQLDFVNDIPAEVTDVEIIIVQDTAGDFFIVVVYNGHIQYHLNLVLVTSDVAQTKFLFSLTSSSNLRAITPLEDTQCISDVISFIVKTTLSSHNLIVSPSSLSSLTKTVNEALAIPVKTTTPSISTSSDCCYVYSVIHFIIRHIERFFELNVNHFKELDFDTPATPLFNCFYSKDIEGVRAQIADIYPSESEETDTTDFQYYGYDLDEKPSPKKVQTQLDVKSSLQQDLDQLLITQKLKHSCAVNAFCFCIKTTTKCSWCGTDPTSKIHFALEINKESIQRRYPSRPTDLESLLQAHLPFRKEIICATCPEQKSEITETFASLPKALIIRLTGHPQPVIISSNLSLYLFLSSEAQLGSESIEFSPTNEINSQLPLKDIYTLSHYPTSEELSVFDISNENERKCGSQHFVRGSDWERSTSRTSTAKVSTKTKSSVEEKYTYRLLSAICHYDSLADGHCVTYAKEKEGSWWLHDTNSDCKKGVDEQTVLTEISLNGYVLLYQHQYLE